MLDVYTNICIFLNPIESYKISLSSKLLTSYWECFILKIILVSDVIKFKSWSLLYKYPNHIYNDVNNLCQVACQYNYVFILDWMKKMNKQISIIAPDLCAIYGSLEALHWLQINYPTNIRSMTLPLAAEYDHFDVVEYLHKTTFKNIKTNSIDYACRSKNLELVKWLHEMRYNECTVEAMDNAADKGSIDILNFLRENRNEGCSSAAIDYAASNEHLNVLQWFHKHHIKSGTTKAMDNACMNGNLNILRYLHLKLNLTTSEDAVSLAAIKGHKHIVKWLLDNDLPSNLFVAFVCACNSRHFDIAKMVRDYIISKNYIKND